MKLIKAVFYLTAFLSITACTTIGVESEISRSGPKKMADPYEDDDQPNQFGWSDSNCAHIMADGHCAHVTGFNALDTEDDLSAPNANDWSDSNCAHITADGDCAHEL